MAPDSLRPVSIVIGTYNAEAFAAAAIESALAQDHPACDLVVVDDASTDRTREVIARYADRVRTVFRPVNGGQSVAYDEAWRATRGEIVIFLDGDDLLEPHAASTVARHWRPELAKLQFQRVPIDERGRVIGPARPIYPPGLDAARLRALILDNWSFPAVPGCGNAYARWFLERRGGVVGLTWWDQMLEVEAPFFGEVASLNEPLARKREHGSAHSLSGVVTVERFSRLREMYRSQLRFFAERCAEFGIAFDHDAVLSRSAWYGDLELVLARLAPGSRPGERAALLARALAATIRGSEPTRKRLALALWEILVALAPRPLAERAIGWRFLPATRPGIGRLPGGEARVSSLGAPGLLGRGS